MKRVVVALSGGVDSAVAALFLKQRGYEVYAVHMQNWDEELNEGLVREGVGCSGANDLEIVKDVCRRLDIPLYKYSFVIEYWQYVFESYLDSLTKDLNTNPDVSCNRHIKFGVLLENIKRDFGEDVKLATGHWARIIDEGGRFRLGVCENLEKDQTYFLSTLTEDQLSKVIFPLQDVSSKEELRRIAKENGISNWGKKDSTGICFIGKRKYRDFISKYIPEKIGDFLDVETGEVLGQHRGAHLYVLHQRSGLQLKGYAEKYYVCRKDIEKNIVFLCRHSKIKDFLHFTITKCNDLNWINGEPKEGEDMYIKTRHSPNFYRATVVSIGNGVCTLSHEKMYVTSPGQRIVFYDSQKKICLGGGMYFLGEKQ